MSLPPVQDLIEILKNSSKKQINKMYENFKVKDFPISQKSPHTKHTYDDQFYVDLSSLSEEHLLTLHQYTNWLAASYFLRKKLSTKMEALTEDELFFMIQCSSTKAKNIIFQKETRLENYSDEVLVLMAKENNQDALDVLVERFIPFVKKITGRLNRVYYFRGMDEHDLFQEGIIGLFKAKQDYKIEKKTKFKDFTKFVITRHIRTIIIRSKNYKNRTLNKSFSYHSPISSSDSEITFEQLLKGETFIPDRTFEKVETYEAISESLTELEQKVLKHYTKDFSYQEIADELGINRKAVDNAIQRIRKKGNSYMKQFL